MNYFSRPCHCYANKIQMLYIHLSLLLHFLHFVQLSMCNFTEHFMLVQLSVCDIAEHWVLVQREVVSTSSTQTFSRCTESVCNNV